MRKTARKVTPSFLLKGYRLLRYQPERRRFWKEIRLRRAQDKLFAEHCNLSASNLVIFLVPGVDNLTGIEKISGGVISIVSLCEESKAILNGEQEETLLCTFGDDALLLKHQLFDNNTWVYRLPQVARHFRQLGKLIIHIPEFLVGHFLEHLSPLEKRWLDSLENVHINVLNQNIRLMPEPEVIRQLERHADSLSITTAHQKYCTPQFRAFYGVPIHKLSVWISPEQYQFRRWEEKENLMVVSPDPHPEKEEVMKLLGGIPNLEVRVIQNLTYKEYKELISRAKWSLTFGEGLDGYFIEPVFSGAIAMAVFNDQFFTMDFQSLPTVYADMGKLKDSIASDMLRLDQPDSFLPVQKEQFDLCAFYYSKTQYRENIASFYRKEYTYG